MIRTWSRASRRILPITRSQCAFTRGARGALKITSRSSASKTASDAAPYVSSRSRGGNRSESVRLPGSAARFRACRTARARVGRAVTPVMCSRRVPCSRNAGAYNRPPSAVSTWRKSTATMPRPGPSGTPARSGRKRRGAGSSPAACGICHTVEAAIGCPGRAGSPWTLLCPHRGFSLARRRVGFSSAALVGGRPVRPRRRRGPTSPRSVGGAKPGRVPGVIGRTARRRRRAVSADSAVSQNRSAGSWRTGSLSCRRSTAFSCRSTSSRASLGRVAAQKHRRDGQRLPGHLVQQRHDHSVHDPNRP
ncbi:hypothetical protein SHIRM173S_04123 [Streptomyces hirsutus]